MSEIDELEFDYLIEEYVLPATLVPLEGWATADLVRFSHLIAGELQRRHDATKGVHHG